MLGLRGRSDRALSPARSLRAVVWVWGFGGALVSSGGMPWTPPLLLQVQNGGQLAGCILGVCLPPIWWGWGRPENHTRFNRVNPRLVQARSRGRRPAAQVAVGTAKRLC